MPYFPDQKLTYCLSVFCRSFNHRKYAIFLFPYFPSNDLPVIIILIEVLHSIFISYILGSSQFYSLFTYYPVFMLFKPEVSQI